MVGLLTIKYKQKIKSLVIYYGSCVLADRNGVHIGADLQVRIFRFIRESSLDRGRGTHLGTSQPNGSLKG